MRHLLFVVIVLFVAMGCNMVTTETASNTRGNNTSTVTPSSSNNPSTVTPKNSNNTNNNNTSTNTPAEGEIGQVSRVIDGDTIDVVINGEEKRVRYVGVNTPERDEVCYSDATAANRRMVEGQTVRLVKDVSETDRYGRLLRLIYVGDTFVNRELVAQGYAEAVLYNPDDGFHDEFVQLEREAIREQRGCHPTGIFDDGSTTR
jgi:micrococcal nuclease